MLQIRTLSSNRRICALGKTSTVALKYANLTVVPRFESPYEINVEFYVLKTLTKTLPDRDINIETWNHIRGLIWADPKFNKVGPIHLLLGADVVSDILKEGLIKKLEGKPVAQETEFGWIFSGRVDPNYESRQISCMVSTQEDKDDLGNLQKFWEMEEINPKRSLTSEEQSCEEFFIQTLQRDMNGNFLVKIPFKDGKQHPGQLGESRGQAMARFLSLERKLSNNEELRKEYIRVIKEYVDLGHMINVTNLPDTQKLYFIPHHAVLKPESTTTKTRVVFDASAKTTTGLSLNASMMIGSKQQRELSEILISWRQHKIVFKADIEKMYRQIIMDPEDQRYHTILWRNNKNEKIQEFQLTRVTFGVAAAPYLATRTLKQLALENKELYPIGSQKILDDCYVDDLISGTHTTEDAINAKNELIKIFKNGNMSLRKWTSNSQELLNTIPVELTERSLQSFTEDESTKALGLLWSPVSDNFKFKVNFKVYNNGNLTKRTLLSEASKVFDPLGLLAPMMTTAKLLMQEVWQTDIDWDDKISDLLMNKWVQFRTDLAQIGSLEIERWIHWNSNSKLTLHGFCDASEKAYAAVIYTRIQQNNDVYISLIASKTRAAAIKSKLTLPKLELCGSVLLTRLLESVKNSLKLENVETYAWSDSMVTLGWLKGQPSRWNNFVANRVAEVQLSNNIEWNYVKSSENPADCASRGIMPSELKNHPLWWNGPTWLKNDPRVWTKESIPDHELDQRKIIVNLARIEENDVIERFSSWNKLIRFTAYSLRFKNRHQGPLAVEELSNAKIMLLKRCQEESFPNELYNLRKEKVISKGSNLLTLNPFLNTDGLIRVGGRLANANITFGMKHPIILPSKHHITTLIIQQMHDDTLHGGPKIMRGLLQKKYWILRSKTCNDTVYKKCVICRRYNGHLKEQIMGDLPEARVTLDRAFRLTGVDYTGPVEIKSSKLRNARILKGYIALFISMGTKAVHLELVSDMTTEAFLAAFQRFMARRGLVSRMYSDNGTNFVGGANKLEQNWLHTKNIEVAGIMANKGVDWKFIPPGSPNFGSIWERNIRSMKDHLKRTLKTSKLTFEEYNTVLCSVEACLNSRPLCPLTNDIESLNVLTPHFLIGEALLSSPQPAILDNTTNRLDRWKHLQVLQQQFWKQWQNDYLIGLQQRYRWKEIQPNIKKGEMVLLKDENLPPRSWSLGRILETHPGPDGNVRVATIRMMGGTVQNPTVVITKRPVRKLCPLGVEEPENQRPIQQEPEPSPGVRYNLRSRAVNSMLLILLCGFLLFGGCLAQNQESPIRISEFQYQAGLYLENLGNAEVVGTHWHIIIYFDLDEYFYEFKHIQEFSNNVRTLCDDDMDIHCPDITTSINENISEIKSLNSLLKSNKQIMPQGQREKRTTYAPFSGIGWLGHELFGLMDADHADKLENQVLTAEDNEKHVMMLIRNQTSLMENTLNIMQRTQTEINANYGRLDGILSEMKNESYRERKQERFLGMAMYLNLLVIRFEKTQRKMLNMLTDLQQGHISGFMFTPTQLSDQLSLINNNLPKDRKLPEEPQPNLRYDLRSFYTILRGKARVTEKYILIDLTIPLVSTTEYQMFKIIPVPIQHGNGRISIVPESDFLLINLKRDSFYQLNVHEAHTCLKLTNFICKLTSPCYTAQSNKSRCERELLLHQREINQHCKLQASNDEDAWIPLQDGNTWIYSVVQRLTLNIICGTELLAKDIQASGIITARPGCEIVQPGLTLAATSNKQSKGRIDFTPKLNLSEFVAKPRQNQSFHIFHAINNTAQINNIRTQLVQLKEQSSLQKSHYTVAHGIHFTLTIICIFIAIIIWKKRLILAKWLALCYTSSNMVDQLDHQVNQHDTITKSTLPTPAKRSNDTFEIESEPTGSTGIRHEVAECSRGTHCLLSIQKT